MIMSGIVEGALPNKSSPLTRLTVFDSGSAHSPRPAWTADRQQ
jgi:hypothetical protein